VSAAKGKVPLGAGKYQGTRLWEPEKGKLLAVEPEARKECNRA
jgi:hypothetical protein